MGHALERLQNQGDDKARQFLASIMRLQLIIALVIAEHILHSTCLSVNIPPRYRLRHSGSNQRIQDRDWNAKS